jgi:hypothetical protein
VADAKLSTLRGSIRGDSSTTLRVYSGYRQSGGEYATMKDNPNPKQMALPEVLPESKKGITVDDVLRIFPGARVVSQRKE